MHNPLAGVRLRAVSVVCAALLGTGLAVPGAGAAWGAEPAAAPVGQGFTLTPSDLAFILRQIKIAERHADTLSPSNPCGTLVGPGPGPDPGPVVVLRSAHRRRSCNNLFAGRETFGTADRVFPRLSTAPDFRSAEPITASFPVGAPGPTSYEQRSGAVIDSQPRVISNLIDDQTSTNPAAVAAAGFPVRAQPGAPRTVACTTDPDPEAVPPALRSRRVVCRPTRPCSSPT